MKTADLPPKVFRVSPDPWKLWAPLHQNRFDISAEPSISTVYLGETQEAAFAEVLSCFWPKIAEQVLAIPADDDPPNSQIIPASWIQQKKLGVGTLAAGLSIVDLAELSSITDLRRVPELGVKAKENGFSDVDESSLKAGGRQGRALTQAVAAYLYGLDHDGVRYGSRLSDVLKCMAVFIPTAKGIAGPNEFLETAEILEDPVSLTNDALKRVVADMGLQLGE